MEILSGIVPCCVHVGGTAHTPAACEVATLKSCEGSAPANKFPLYGRAEIKQFLKAEGYDLASSPSSLDARLYSKCDPVQSKRLDRTFSTRNEKLRLQRLYAFPKTLEQAHLLFSHDRERILRSFEWILGSIPVEAKRIADVGCGTGTLARLIGNLRGDAEIVGVDSAANLVAAAQTALNSANTRFAAMDMTRLSTLGQFDVVVSACGIEQPFLPEPTFEDIVASEGRGIMPGYRRTIASAYGQMLSGIRKAASNDAQLIAVFRIPTQTHFATLADVAAEIGWELDSRRSKKLRVENETFPATIFRAGKAGGRADPSAVSKLY